MITFMCILGRKFSTRHNAAVLMVFSQHFWYSFYIKIKTTHFILKIFESSFSTVKLLFKISHLYSAIFIKLVIELVIHLMWNRRSSISWLIILISIQPFKISLRYSSKFFVHMQIVLHVSHSFRWMYMGCLPFACKKQIKTWSSD